MMNYVDFTCAISMFTPSHDTNFTTSNFTTFKEVNRIMRVVLDKDVERLKMVVTTKSLYQPLDIGETWTAEPLVNLQSIVNYCKDNYGKDFPSCMMVMGSMFPILFGKTYISKSSCLNVLLVMIGVFQNDYNPGHPIIFLKKYGKLLDPDYVCTLLKGNTY